VSDNLRSNLSRLRVTLLPDLIYSIGGPFLIYRLVVPYVPVTTALLLAGVPPLIRIGIGLVHRRRLNLLGGFSLLTVALKIFSALLLKDSRLVLVGDSLITGVYGVLMLTSLLFRKPLVLRLLRSMLANASSAQSQQLTQPWQEENTRSFFMVITAVVGLSLLLEFVMRLLLVFTLPVEQFLLISSIVRYGILGLMLLCLFLFIRLCRSRQEQMLERSPQQQAQETSHTPI
jgi:hypothetical protein